MNQLQQNDGKREFYVQHINHRRLGASDDLGRWARAFARELKNIFLTEEQPLPKRKISALSLPISVAHGAIEKAKRESEKVQLDQAILAQTAIEHLIIPNASHCEILENLEQGEAGYKITEQSTERYKRPNYQEIARDILRRIQRTKDEKGEITREDVIDIIIKTKYRVLTVEIPEGISTIPEINTNFARRNQHLQELLDRIGITDFPHYILNLRNGILEGQPINVAKAWQVSPEYFRKLGEQADLLAQQIFGDDLDEGGSHPLHPDVVGNHDGASLQKILVRCRMATADDFHRVRSAIAKLHIMYGFFFAQSNNKYNPERLQQISLDLKRKIDALCHPAPDGTIMLNGTQRIARIEVDEKGKQLARVVMKNLAEGQTEEKNVQDTIRFRVVLHPEDCHTAEDIDRTMKNVLSILLAALDTNTIIDNSVDYINIIPLEAGDESLSLEEFETKMQKGGHRGNKGTHGLSSLAYRAFACRVNRPHSVWQALTPRHDFAGNAAAAVEQIELQIKLPTPDDHEAYERRQIQKIREQFGFSKKTKKGGETVVEPITFETFITDLINGFHAKGNLDGEYPKEVPLVVGNARPMQEYGLLTIMRALTLQDGEKFTNEKLLHAIRSNKKMKEKTIRLLKRLGEEEQYISPRRARCRDELYGLETHRPKLHLGGRMRKRAQKNIERQDGLVIPRSYPPRHTVEGSTYFDAQGRLTKKVYNTGRVEEFKTDSDWRYPFKVCAPDGRVYLQNKQGKECRNLIKIERIRVTKNGLEQLQEVRTENTENGSGAAKRRVMNIIEIHPKTGDEYRYDAIQDGGDDFKKGHLQSITYKKTQVGKPKVRKILWTMPRDPETHALIEGAAAEETVWIDYHAIDSEGHTNRYYYDAYTREEGEMRLRTKSRLDPLAQKVIVQEYERGWFSFLRRQKGEAETHTPIYS